MQTEYYVSHAGAQMGPYSPEEIIDLVNNGTLAPLDYIYDEAKADWVVFMEHEVLAGKIMQARPKTPPKTVEQPAVKKPSVNGKVKFDDTGVPAPVVECLNQEWFVLKGENKFGPFSYTDLIKMLQEGAVFEFDFAWHEGLETWQRIAEMKAFSREHISTLKASSLPEITKVFYRRRHRRVKYGGTILVHDNNKVWKGTAVEISEGGAGLVMENSLVVPGHKLYLHFKPGDGVPPFNAICEVVSKGFVNGMRDAKASVKYGVKFVSLNNETQKFLHDFSKAGKAA